MDSSPGQDIASKNNHSVMLFALKLQNRLRKVFEFDYRSLAVFRISLGIFMLSDLLVRAQYLAAHYTDFGVLPRGPLIEKYLPYWRISVHMMSGAESVQAILFLIHAFFAFMMIVGYRTRLFTFLTWFMLISLQSRNYMVLQGGDVFIRVIFFIAIFLPLGQSLSMDRRLGRISRPKGRYKNWFDASNILYFFQIAFVYWFTAWIKLSGESHEVWWNQARAVHDALLLDQFRQPFGDFLLSLPMEWLRHLNRLVILGEVVIPIFLFSPFLIPVSRIIAILGIVGLHLGLGAALALGPFPWIGCFAMLPFIPSEFWRAVLPKKGFRELWREKHRIRYLSARRPSNATVQETQDASKSISAEQKQGFMGRVLFVGKQIAIIYFLIIIFLWNLGGVITTSRELPGSNALAFILSIDQKWNMFSPPLRDDGWFVIPGTLTDGSQVDLFQEGKPVSWEKPERVADTFPTQRWRKYMMNLWLKDHSEQRLYYGKYLCRNWNERVKRTPEKLLQTFKIFYMREDTLPDKQETTPEKVLLWTHYCFEVLEETNS